MTRIVHRDHNPLPDVKLSNASRVGFRNYNPGAMDRGSPLHDTSNEVAFAYDQAGQDYSLYADGNSEELFDFSGIHAYADRRLWERLNSTLLDLRETGVTSVNILDAGCGPGTWLRRLVVRAHEIGFTTINARGFDIAREQIRRARFLSKGLEALPGVRLRFDTSDLNARFAEDDDSVDITVCLYSVLSHLPATQMEKIAAEIARVTRGVFVTTVRPVGSQPTIFVDSIEKAAAFKYDATADRFEVLLNDGRRFTLGVHLFSAAELEGLFAKYFGVTELVGLDLFHSRFAPDPGWNPTSQCAEDILTEHLSRLEEIFAADPAFLEHATHLMLIGSRRHAN